MLRHAFPYGDAMLVRTPTLHARAMSLDIPHNIVFDGVSTSSSSSSCHGFCILFFGFLVILNVFLVFSFVYFGIFVFFGYCSRLRLVLSEDSFFQSFNNPFLYSTFHHSSVIHATQLIQSTIRNTRDSTHSNSRNSSQNGIQRRRRMSQKFWRSICCRRP